MAQANQRWADWFHTVRDFSSERGTPQERRRGLDRDLDALIDQHAAAAYRVANGILRNPTLAEDAVQETMIKAWQSLPRFRGDSSLRSWILRIAHNTSISMLRRRRERVMAPEDLPDEAGGIDPARSSTALEDLRTVRSALESLDELSRSVVILREVEGMSYAEIAETLQVPVPTVKTRLLRARRKLADALEDETDGSGTPDSTGEGRNGGRR